MVVLIASNQTISNKNRAKKIAKEFLSMPFDEINFVKYDATNYLIQDIVSDALYLPLGYEKKVVVVEDCYFLEKKTRKNKLSPDQDFSSLNLFINHPNEEVLLILVVNSLSLTNDEIIKSIKEHGKYIEIPDVDPKGWKDGVRKYCKETLKMNIEENALNELAERSNNDLAILQSNCAKLMLYSDKIKLDDVLLLVNKPLDDKAFDLFNYLLSSNKNDALSLYRDLKVNNTEPVILISMLSNQFRLLSEIKYLSSLGYDNDSIAKQLGIKSGRVFIMKKNSQYFNMKRVHKVLDDLFSLDLNIKSGLADRFYSFELFILNF